MHKDNWDDLRYVLAVAEAGSVSGAARVLGVNHATVLRRVAAFEERAGSPVFERTATGYVVAPDKLRVIEAAREVETSVLAVARLVQGRAAPFRGAVRITSTDTFCHDILPRIIQDLTRRAPDLQISLFCNNSHLDFARLSADITVRPAITLPDDLFGEQAGVLGFGVYALDDGVQDWLALRGQLARSRPADWMEKSVPHDRIRSGADSFLVLRSLAVLGLGRAILPCVLGDAEPRLMRLRDAMPAMTVPIWVASHLDLADSPRIRASRNALVQALTARAAALSG